MQQVPYSCRFYLLTSSWSIVVALNYCIVSTKAAAKAHWAKVRIFVQSDFKKNIFYVLKSQKYVQVIEFVLRGLS